MEKGINKGAELERRQWPFIFIGFVVLLGLSLILFNLKCHQSRPEQALHSVQFEYDKDAMLSLPPVEVKRDKIIKPLQINVLSPMMVSNEVQIEDNLNITTEFSEKFVVPSVEKIAMKIADENPPDDKVYLRAEEMPMFMGGNYDKFRDWIAIHLRYPEIAAENGISGRVTIRFSVNNRGEVCDVAIMRGVDPSLDREAIRVISSSPRWIPGKIKGKPVKVQYNVPVVFDLK